MTSTPESAPEPRWKCRADHFVYGYCDGPVGARPGHNSCGWSDPPAASSPDEGGEATICRRCGGLGPDHQTWCSVRTFAGDPPASADEGARQRPDTEWATSPEALQHARRALDANATATTRCPFTRSRCLAFIDEIERLRSLLDAAPPAPSTGAPQRMETVVSRFAWLADSARSEGFHEAAAAYMVCRDELSDALTPTPPSTPDRPASSSGTDR